ncbi:MAG: carph-isopro domain-containing protein [Alphaproteobacteria bacterium]
MTVTEIIEAFGGVCSMARKLGIKYPSIVQGWKNRDKIPEWRMLLIEAKAKEYNIDIQQKQKE